jgi:hypothetical protein
MEKITIRRRIHGTLTAAQKRRVKKAQAQVAAELPELIRRNQLRNRARKEQTFSGALRRAIHQFPISATKIAELAGIPWDDLSAFLTGEQTLSSDAIDALVRVVKLKVPTSKMKPARRVRR